MKRVLLIGGGGTLGGYTATELLKLGYDVDVVALERLEGFNRHLRYVCGRADDELLKKLFAEGRYAAIVDFLHYVDTEAYESRAKLLLANTDQLVFLSSYRVYARSGGLITEDSPQLADTVTDSEFLTNETYAVPKSRNEKFLRSLPERNWTIVRPLISSSVLRLDLVTLCGHEVVLQARDGRPVLLPRSAKDLPAGVGWAGNIGKMIANLVGKTAALGEAFTLGTSESFTWGEVADIYSDLLGLRVVWTDDNEEYLANATGNSYMERCMLYYDRLLGKRVDNSKMLRVSGLKEGDFTCFREALIGLLDELSRHPELVAAKDTPQVRAVLARMNAVTEGR